MFRTKTASILVTLFLVCLFCVAWIRVESRTPGQSWEYKVLEVNTGNQTEFERVLNQQGLDRWELVQGGNQSAGWSTFIFKRMK